MKILFLLPHCSTGGMPQYVLKMVQTLDSQVDIVGVVECHNLTNDYVVQRKKMPHLVQINGDGQKIFDLIEKHQPDIVHCQEYPESFLSKENLVKLYNKDRKYRVLVTVHGSLTRRKDFKYIPDGFVAVSNWQKELWEKEFPECPVDIWEYPIEDLKPSIEEKEAAKKVLYNNMLNAKVTSNKPKHILNVGLFTPGKNQGELFEIARKDTDNYYHFVGNTAPNFESYWRPLLKNKPDNCIIWGERDDVDLFYKACDEMYFTSKLELNPICVKEALSYGLPITMRRLHTYLSDYDNNPLVTFIKDEQPINNNDDFLSKKALTLIKGLIDIIHLARRKENNRKNHVFAEELRLKCKELGVILKDNNDGTTDWKLI